VSGFYEYDLPEPPIAPDDDTSPPDFICPHSTSDEEPSVQVGGRRIVTTRCGACGAILDIRPAP
jgi:hypothetical protein